MPIQSGMWRPGARDHSSTVFVPRPGIVASGASAASGVSTNGRSMMPGWGTIRRSVAMRSLPQSRMSRSIVRGAQRACSPRPSSSSICLSRSSSSSGEPCASHSATIFRNGRFRRAGAVVAQHRGRLDDRRDAQHRVPAARQRLERVRDVRAPIAEVRAEPKVDVHATIREVSASIQSCPSSEQVAPRARKVPTCSHTMLRRTEERPHGAVHVGRQRAHARSRPRLLRHGLRGRDVLELGRAAVPQRRRRSCGHGERQESRQQRAWGRRNATATPEVAAEALKSDFPAIAKVARAVVIDRKTMVANGANAVRLFGVAVDPEFLDMFALPFVAGDAHSALLVAAQRRAHERVRRATLRRGRPDRQDERDRQRGRHDGHRRDRRDPRSRRSSAARPTRRCRSICSPRATCTRRLGHRFRASRRRSAAARRRLVHDEHDHLRSTCRPAARCPPIRSLGSSAIRGASRARADAAQPGVHVRPRPRAPDARGHARLLRHGRVLRGGAARARRSRARRRVRELRESRDRARGAPRARDRRAQGARRIAGADRSAELVRGRGRSRSPRSLSRSRCSRSRNRS